MTVKLIVRTADALVKVRRNGIVYLLTEHDKHSTFFCEEAFLETKNRSSNADVASLERLKVVETRGP